MTPQQIATATGAPLAIAASWAQPITAACNLFGITTPQRQAAFLSQIGVESAGLQALRENMNYSDGALLSVFGSRITPVEASMYGRTPTHAADQQMIANIVYASRFGNGDVSSGDGWAYRGGGCIGLTFRDNYRTVGRAIGIALEAQPDLIAQPPAAAMSAAMYWRDHGCNELADAGAIVAITRKINGGTNGLVDRQRLYAQALPAMLA